MISERHPSTVLRAGSQPPGNPDSESGPHTQYFSSLLGVRLFRFVILVGSIAPRSR